MQTKNQPKDGRSLGYSAEIAETICERLINGESLTGPDGKVTWVFDKEHVARQRLKIKALKWTMARMAPRKYGSHR